MRYDGSARRSKTYNQSIIDKTWNFFSSVKVGVWLIVIALIASGIGTIFPQQLYIPENAPSRDPAIFYEDRYGIFGKIYYQLGFYDLYNSWWYMIIIALIGIRSEEHTSELQSRGHLVCRLLLEKKKK